MRHTITGLLLTGAISLAGPGTAVAEEVDCASIDDATERLACYDRRFERTPEASEPPEAAEVPEVSEAPEPPAAAEPSAAEEAAAAAGAAVIVEEPVAQQEPAAPEPEPAKSEPAAETQKSGFLGDELVDIDTTIRAIRRGEQQRMVFMLDNGEIWMQVEPRLLPYREGDVVNVKNARFGGYFMRSEKGTSTRVKRIAQ